MNDKKELSQTEEAYPDQTSGRKLIRISILSLTPSKVLLSILNEANSLVRRKMAPIQIVTIAL